ncbi:hypothetical protein RN001_003143, partial [Aquatica leii]
MNVFTMGAQKLTKSFMKNYLKNCKSFDHHCQKVNFIKLGNGSCVAEMKVEEEYANPMKTLHGAYVATLADTLTTLALLTHEKCPLLPSISLSLNLSYLKSAKVGEEIIIDSQIVKLGNTMAHLECKIFDKGTNSLLVHATHTKIAAQKLNLSSSPHRRKRHNSDDVESSGFCGVLQRSPPPVPPALLRRIGVKEVTGVGK